VIVYEINIVCAAVLESKDNSPISRYGHGPEAGQLSFQGMEPIAWQPHILNGQRFVESGQDTANLLDLCCGQLSTIIILKEARKPLVLEILNHCFILHLSGLDVKYGLTRRLGHAGLNNQSVGPRLDTALEGVATAGDVGLQDMAPIFQGMKV
jgi:hypothetical protein